MKPKELRANPLVSIIIDNWDGRHYLKNCLPAVFNQNYPNFEVIVIDDASRDNSAGYVEENFPKVKLIKNKNHLGFAAANNQGIRLARGKYILLLNNDTEVTPGFLFPLVQALEAESSLGAAQSKIRLIPERRLLDDVASYLTPIGFLYHIGFFEKDQKKYNRRYFTFSPKGACFFIRKKVLDKVGLLDERFYCYFEESDLAWRIWLAGYRIIYEPRSIIYHHLAGSQKKQSRPKIDYLAIKNRLNSLLTSLSWPFLLIILPLHLLTLSFFILYYFFTFKWANLAAVLSALLWNLKQFPATCRKRLLVQKKIRTVSDWELFKKTFRTPSLAYYGKLFLAYQKGR